MSKIAELKALLKNNDMAAILLLVKENPGVLKEKDENNTTGLLSIAYQSNKEIIAEIAQLADNFTFYEAIVCGQDAQVRTDINSDPGLLNAYSPDGFTPVALACFFSQDEIADFLIKQGADPNIGASNPSKVNALHAAIARNNFDLVKMLIGNGADVNATQMQNVTPLHSAVHRGNLLLVKLLVEHAADINSKMDNGDTAISIATRDGRQEIKAYLEK